MTEILGLPQWVTTAFVSYLYLALFLFFLISESGIPLPFPNYLLLIFAAYLAAQGQGLYPFIILFSVAGILLGALILYLLSSRGARPLLERFGKYIRLDPLRIRKIETWFRRHGFLAIILGRLAPGFRLQTAIAAGIFRLPKKSYAVCVTIAALIWVGFYLWVGTMLHYGSEELGHYLKIHSYLILLILGGISLLALLLAYIRRARRKRMEGDAPTLTRDMDHL